MLIPSSLTGNDGTSPPVTSRVWSLGPTLGPFPCLFQALASTLGRCCQTQIRVWLGFPCRTRRQGNRRIHPWWMLSWHGEPSHAQEAPTDLSQPFPVPRHCLCLGRLGCRPGRHRRQGSSRAVFTSTHAPLGVWRGVTAPLPVLLWGLDTLP